MGSRICAVFPSSKTWEAGELAPSCPLHPTGGGDGKLELGVSWASKLEQAGSKLE